MSALQIHYDCDPGQDDAIALLYALGCGVDIKSISIVGGNVDVQKCTRNALQILEFTNRNDIPVYTGAAAPLKRLSQPLPDVFGECGMAGANLPDPTTQVQKISAEIFLSTLAFPNIVVATGPLTNLALAIQKNKFFSEHVKHLVIMGGCVYPEHIHGKLGNIQVKGSEEWAEYNFAVDPEAAQIVFASGIKNISIIPVELTRRVLFNHKIESRLRALGTKTATLVANILSTVGAEDKIDYASEMEFDADPVRAIHDVVAMVYLTNPEIFETKLLPLRIETRDPPYAGGQTIIDQQNCDHKNINVITKINKDEFFNKLIESLGNLK